MYWNKKSVGVGSLPALLLFPLGAMFAQVEEAWVARYESGGRGPDYAKAVELDASGNVYVTGWIAPCGGPGCWDYGTVKFDHDGERLWVARYGGLPWDGADSLAVDEEGNVYVTGFANVGAAGRDAVTIKYDAEGNELWVAFHDKGSNDGGRRVVLDGAGNIFVTSRTGGDDNYDAALLKYDTEGKQIWAVEYDGPAGGDDYVYPMVIGPEGNIHVTGYSERSEGVFDFVTLKYDLDDGNRLWVARHPGTVPRTTIDLPGLAVDRSGNVLVVGTAGEPQGGQDLVVIKYGADGAELWSRRYDGPDGGDDHARAVAVDPSGNVYVVGASWGGEPDEGGTSFDMVVIQYDPDGVQTWLERRDGRWEGDDYAVAVAVGAGGVYVAGHSFRGAPEEGGTGLDYTTLKYDPEGNEIWEMHYDGPGSGSDTVAAMAVDASETVYVLGTSWGGRGSVIGGTGTGDDYAVVKYVQTAAFLRGDSDADGRVNLTDAAFTLNFLFTGGPAPGCTDAADSDDNGALQITDPVYALNFLFLGGPEIPAPGVAECAVDPTEDDLGCAVYEGCGA